jgi:hypothetical protein
MFNQGLFIINIIIITGAAGITVSTLLLDHIRESSNRWFW